MPEFLGLKWDDNVDFEAGEIRPHHDETKSGEPRTLPFTPEVAVLLREQRKRIIQALGKLTSWVFPYLPGEHARKKLIGTLRQGFHRSWASATKAAGLPGLLVHDLRRAAVRNLIRAGVSQKVAQEISGHKSANVFSRYNIVSANDRRDAMAKVAAFHISGGK